VIHLVRLASIVGVVGCWLTGGIALAAEPAVVLDGAQFFSREAVQQAQEAMQALQDRYQKDLVIETFARPPLLARTVHNLNNDEQRERYVANWARRLSHKAGADGIYVLICQDPLEVQVVAGRRVRGKAFRSRDGLQLAALLKSELQEGHADEGLREAVQFVRRTVQANLGLSEEPPAPFPWAAVVLPMLVLLGVWLGGEFSQALRQRKGLPVRTAHPAEASFLAGLFAAVTSSWPAGLFAELFRPRRPVITPGATTLTFPPNAAEAATKDYRPAGLQEYAHGEP
jgi:hypothetical protein